MLRPLLGQIYRDQRGQDMIEYALMAAFITTAAVVALPPGIVESMRQLYLRIGDYITSAAGRI